MPLFLDRHDIPGVTAVDLAIAHARDVQIEKQYGVRYITYWFDPSRGTAFCLAEGPDAIALPRPTPPPSCAGVSGISRNRCEASAETV